MSKYNVNFKKLALLLLPTFWRKPLLAAFAYAAVSPLCSLHTLFMAYRNESGYRLAHNGQVCYLRAVLNDAFDAESRRITITENTAETSGLLAYARQEGKGELAPFRVSSRPVIMNRRGFSGANKLDFWVNIPYQLRQKVDTNRLYALINTYKLASKRFSINYI